MQPQKYLTVFNLGIQNTFVYRWNYLLRAFFGLIPLVGTIFLWRAIFRESGGGMRGYDYGSMIYYYLLTHPGQQSRHADRRRMADRSRHSRGPDQFLPDQADELSRLPLQHFSQRPPGLHRGHDSADRG